MEVNAENGWLLIFF